MTSFRGRAATTALCLLFAGSAIAGTMTTLRDAARQTVTNNPQVRSAVSEFEASEEQVRVAKGGYLPRVDLQAGIGHERIDDPLFDENDFTRDRVSVLLNQMLFDGFWTRNTVQRFDYAARMRYFEVWSASERISAEVARAYYDVLRHREFVELSKENYAAHRVIHEQIERRVQAGVSRRVDLDQAYGRLALAESNLLTDLTNLHDVSMTYQRLVGETPAAALEEPDIASNLLPADFDEMLRESYATNPMLNAAVANVWSAKSAADAQKATMLPRLDVQARQDIWHDKDDISGRYEEGLIELVLNYNLYNGGSDRAERRRLLHKAQQAADQRDQACRDIRQEVAIAYNEVQALEQQQLYLGRHRDAIDRAREAYRRQFDIGQRTLLDMLDTENEYYSASRAWVTAKRERDIAYARALAGMGTLVRALELGDDIHAMAMPEADEDDLPDLYAVCPPEQAVIPVVDKDAIFREALERQGDLQLYRSSDAARGNGTSTEGVAPASPTGW
jgi:adhesin transport system outer membrane protein